MPQVQRTKCKARDKIFVVDGELSSWRLRTGKNALGQELEVTLRIPVPSNQV